MMMMEVVNMHTHKRFESNTTSYVLSTDSLVQNVGGGEWVTITVDSGVTITGSGEGYAMNLELNEDNDVVYLVNNGNIYGEGGEAGISAEGGVGSPGTEPTAGEAGGHALFVENSWLQINNQGIVGGGEGGDGGNGCDSTFNTKLCEYDDAVAASAGSDGAGGAGATGITGTGCASNDPGAAGGAEGNYINGENETTWVNTGTRNGGSVA